MASVSRRASASKGIRDFPSSAEGAIEIDEIRRDLRVAAGKIMFRSAVTGLVPRVAEHSSVMTVVLVSSYFKT